MQKHTFAFRHLGPREEKVQSMLDTIGVDSLDQLIDETIPDNIRNHEDLISIYKHNSALLKKQGDLVRTGEVIALIGNSGEQSTGPHLHFELWHMGNPVDPENFIAF